MTDLAISQSNTISQYSRSNADKAYADSRESLFGHLVIERGRSVKTALEELRPQIRQTLKETESAAGWCQKIGIGSVLLSVLAGASMGYSFGILPVLAGCLSLKFWADSKDELPRREAEYHLLKECSNLPEALYALHLRGVSAIVLVGAYDTLVSSVQSRIERGAGFSESEVGQFLESKISGLIGLENQTQSQSAFQPSEAQGNAPTQDEALAVTELQAVSAQPAMSHINGTDSIAPRDIATDLGNNPQSALIFGTPGAGKGMTISNAIRTLRLKLPNVTVMMVDPKSDPKERGYWESQVDIFESRSLLKSSPRSSAEWMMRCIEKFQDIDGPKLLVWDELMASLTVLKTQNVAKGEDAFPCLTDFQQFLNLNLSLGPSSGIWVWGMSQSANLSDLGLTSGGLSATRSIALISPDNVGAVEGYLATKAITSPKGGMEYLDKLMEQSPVGRACYDGKTKKWYPVARLENHSGFDRDNADWNSMKPAAPFITPQLSKDANPPSISRGTIAHPSSTPTAAPMGSGRRPTRIRLGASSATPDRAWSTVPAEKVPDEPLDPAIELINAEPNIDRRDALMAAYLWAQGKLDKGEEVSRQAFLERARKERKSEYLIANRNKVWEDLQTLLD